MFIIFLTPAKSELHIDDWNKLSMSILYDTVIKNGVVVTASEVAPFDIAIKVREKHSSEF